MNLKRQTLIALKNSFRALMKNSPAVLALAAAFGLSFALGYVSESAVVASPASGAKLAKKSYENLKGDVKDLIRDKDDLVADAKKLKEIYEDLEKTFKKTEATMKGIYGHLGTTLKDIKQTADHVEDVGKIPGEVF